FPSWAPAGWRSRSIAIRSRPRFTAIHTMAHWKGKPRPAYPSTMCRSPCFARPGRIKFQFGSSSLLSRTVPRQDQPRRKKPEPDAPGLDPQNASGSGPGAAIRLSRSGGRVQSPPRIAQELIAASGCSSKYPRTEDEEQHQQDDKCPEKYLGNGGEI